MNYFIKHGNVIAFTAMLFLFEGQLLFSQSNPIEVRKDSMEALLPSTIDPTERVILLNKLASLMIQYNLETGKKYGLEAMEVGKAIPTHEETANTLGILGSLYAESAQWDSVKYYGNLILEHKTTNQVWKARGYTHLAGAMKGIGKTKEAIPYFKKSLEMIEKEGHVRGTMSLYVDLAQAYFELRKFENSLEYYEQALTLAQKENAPRALSLIYNGFARVYMGQNKEDKAEEFINKSIELCKTTGDKTGVLIATEQLVTLYKHFDRPEKYRETVEGAIVLSEEINAPFPIAFYNLYLSDYHIEKGNLKTAKEKLNITKTIMEKANIKGVLETEYLGRLGDVEKKSGNHAKAISLYTGIIAQAEKNQIIEQEHMYRDKLVETYEEMGNYKSAYILLKDLYQGRDSMMKNDNLEKMGEIEAELTNVENERAIVQLENEQIIAQSRTRQLTIGAGALALLGFLGFGFFYNARRKNKVIAQKNNQLESLNHTKDRIFAIIGHDLRKPAISFRGISKVINYLLDNKDYDRLQKVGVEVERDALSLYKLTDNLLSWALMQKDVMPYNPSEVSVAAIAEETIQVFSRVAEEKNITLTSKIPADLSVFADPNAVATIIRNLTDNALKYTPEGGSVTINAVNSPEGAKIIIEDTGIGIEKDKINDIFLLQKDKSERGTAGEKGTGIGMHLIHELVKINQGEVQVESKVGKGTKVVVMLPKRALKAA